jgi:hypothetical protein
MNRRALLIVLLIVVVVAGGLYVVSSRGLSPFSSAKSSTPAKPTATPGGTAVAVAGTPGVTATPTPGTKQSGKPKGRNLGPQRRELHGYAAALIPILDRSVPVFNSVAHQASSTSDLGKLNQICFGNLKRLGVVQAQAEGVPHPSPWYTLVGKYHHKLLGIYHQMVGATDECATAAGNGSPSDAAVAVSIMNRQAQALQSMRTSAHSLAKGPK